ncbi:hypothetical protein FRB91_010843 [Serendipita sp. 411]|nr:hypothetical protein FRC19_009042 [Serendipita sp. 401]KAG8837595.1 hypothetical protein FRC18_008820 [Serendipita sp. 400]KAG8857767.1 hypothetical protein FRB91_010843 [Serendipita sp. 411]KAG9056461.1 hypothetical protein FS842_010559 [Serendipita sp. 407]
MAQRATYYEEELDDADDLAEVGLNLAIGNYGQGGLYDDGMPRIDEATLIAMQQHVAQQVALAQIPDVVKRFIVQFHQAIVNNNLPEITACYENGWNKLTEQFYPKTEWPEAEIIAPLVNDNPVFLILYRELYYRHIYSRLTPNVDDRFHSYENSCELFNYLLNSDGPVALSLPDQWLWDIIDEFIYQFQSFSVWRSKPKLKNEDELSMLAAEAETAGGSQLWSCYSVLNVLYSLVQKSRINEHLSGVRQGLPESELLELAGEYGSRPLYRMLGYFSLIGLLRVHVLLGDFTLALKVMENIELNQKAFFTRVTACHVATYYYVGFSYMALRRYNDAIRTFVSILNFIGRMRQYHTRSYQYDQINKTAERMYALFAICNCLSPSKLDEQILNNAKERYSDQISKMSQPFTSNYSAPNPTTPITPSSPKEKPSPASEALAAYSELFLFACPKFITANAPPYGDADSLTAYIADPPEEPATRHLSLFLDDIRARAEVPTLRSYLKLYTSLDASKLAGFLEKDEEELVQLLMVMKTASRSISRMNNEGALLDGQVITTSDLDFVINENMVHVVESVMNRKYGGWFIRNTEHAQRVYDALKASPLPITKTPKEGATDDIKSTTETKTRPSTQPWTGTGTGAGTGTGTGRRVEFAT